MPGKRFLALLLALAIGAGAAFFSYQVASADWGDEDRILPSRESDTGDPSLAVIDLRHCRADEIARWKKSTLTFRIVNESKLDRNTIDAVRKGVLQWNTTGNPYKLVETTKTADITIRAGRQLLPTNVLGRTTVSCLADGSGIASAAVVLNVQGLLLSGVRNLSGHEAGHALGLGHADKMQDIMYARFDLIVGTLTPICPSNLDIGGLSSKVDPYSLRMTSYSVPRSC